MQMMATTAVTLSALARIDSGSLTVVIDEAIYPEAAVRAFASECEPHCSATIQYSEGKRLLKLVPAEPRSARLQIGAALNDLLKLSLREL